MASPIEQGPFQKYLFSGACYVRIGQCYADFLELMESRGDPVAFARLRDSLGAVWEDAFFRQLAAVSGLPGDALSSLDPGLDRSVREFTGEVRAAGEETMTRLLEDFLGAADAPPDFAEFFQAWAGACDTAYAALVRSPMFAAMLGLVVNACIDLAVSGCGR